MSSGAVFSNYSYFKLEDETLRDLFAVAALQTTAVKLAGYLDLAAGAKACYQIADAMMEARKPRSGPIALNCNKCGLVQLPIKPTPADTFLCENCARLRP